MHKYTTAITIGVSVTQSCFKKILAS